MPDFLRQLPIALAASVAASPERIFSAAPEGNGFKIEESCVIGIQEIGWRVNGIQWLFIFGAAKLIWFQVWRSWRTLNAPGDMAQRDSIGAR